MSTVFTIGMALAGLPTGYLMSRFPRKSVTQIGTFIFSAATLVTVLAAGFTDMLIYRARHRHRRSDAAHRVARDLFKLLCALSRCRQSARSISPLVWERYSARCSAPRSSPAYGTWRAPMIVFGMIGFVMMAMVALFVRRSVSEVKLAAGTAGASRDRRRANLAQPQHHHSGDAELHRRARSVRLSRHVSDLSARAAAVHARRHRHGHEHLRTRRACVRWRRIPRRQVSDAARVGGEFSCPGPDRLAAVQRAQWSSPRKRPWHLPGASWQRGDLCQCRGLSCEGGERRARGARVRHFRDELLYGGVRCRLYRSAGWRANSAGPSPAVCSSPRFVSSAPYLRSRSNRT